jgi:hypothetical protein
MRAVADRWAVCVAVPREERELMRNEGHRKRYLTLLAPATALPGTRVDRMVVSLGDICLRTRDR